MKKVAVATLAAAGQSVEAGGLDAMKLQPIFRAAALAIAALAR